MSRIIRVGASKSSHQGRITLSKARTPADPSGRQAGLPQLNRAESALANAVLRAVEHIPPTAVLDFIEHGDITGYSQAVTSALGDFKPEIQKILLDQYENSGIVEAQNIGAWLSKEYTKVGKAAGDPISASEAALKFSFTTASPTAIKWAETEAGSLVTNMASSSVAGVRNIVHLAYANGNTWNQTSKELRTLLQTVKPGSDAAKELSKLYGVNVNGLTARYEGAVVNRASTIAAQLEKQGITGVKALDKVKKDTQKYADKLRRARANTIARTEIMRASNEGKLAAYQQAVDRGLASAKYSKKVWTTSPFDVCHICAPLNGAQVGLQETFNGGLFVPPAHPNCRCTIQFVTNTKLYTPPTGHGTGMPGSPFGLTHTPFADTPAALAEPIPIWDTAPALAPSVTPEAADAEAVAVEQAVPDMPPATNKMHWQEAEMSDGTKIYYDVVTDNGTITDVEWMWNEPYLGAQNYYYKEGNFYYWAKDSAEWQDISISAISGDIESASWITNNVLTTTKPSLLSELPTPTNSKLLFTKDEIQTPSGNIDIWYKTKYESGKLSQIEYKFTDFGQQFDNWVWKDDKFYRWDQMTDEWKDVTEGFKGKIQTKWVLENFVRPKTPTIVDELIVDTTTQTSQATVKLNLKLGANQVEVEQVSPTEWQFVTGNNVDNYSYETKYLYKTDTGSWFKQTDKGWNKLKPSPGSNLEKLEIDLLEQIKTLPTAVEPEIVTAAPNLSTGISKPTIEVDTNLLGKTTLTEVEPGVWGITFDSGGYNYNIATDTWVDSLTGQTVEVKYNPLFEQLQTKLLEAIHQPIELPTVHIPKGFPENGLGIGAKGEIPEHYYLPDGTVSYTDLDTGLKFEITSDWDVYALKNGVKESKLYPNEQSELGKLLEHIKTNPNPYTEWNPNFPVYENLPAEGLVVPKNGYIPEHKLLRNGNIELGPKHFNDTVVIKPDGSMFTLTNGQQVDFTPTKNSIWSEYQQYFMDHPSPYTKIPSVSTPKVELKLPTQITKVPKAGDIVEHEILPDGRVWVSEYKTKKYDFGYMRNADGTWAEGTFDTATGQFEDFPFTDSLPYKQLKVDQNTLIKLDTHLVGQGYKNGPLTSIAPNAPVVPVPTEPIVPPPSTPEAKVSVVHIPKNESLNLPAHNVNTELKFVDYINTKGTRFKLYDNGEIWKTDPYGTILDKVYPDKGSPLYQLKNYYASNKELFTNPLGIVEEPAAVVFDIPKTKQLPAHKINTKDASVEYTNANGKQFKVLSDGSVHELDANGHWGNKVYPDKGSPLKRLSEHYKGKYDELLNYGKPTQGAQATVAAPVAPKAPLPKAEPVATLPEPKTYPSQKLSQIKGGLTEDKASAAKLGGQNPKKVYTDSQGVQYIFKPQPQWQAEVEAAASQTATKLGIPGARVEVINIDGQVGSLHKVIAHTNKVDDVKAIFAGKTFDPTKLSAAQVEELQQSQIFDYLISNHDSHTEQFIRLGSAQDSQLLPIGIDKGQAFKHFGKTGEADSLLSGLDGKSFYNPNNNAQSKMTYIRIWEDFLGGKDVQVTLPSQSPKIKKLVDGVNSIMKDPAKRQEFITVWGDYAKLAEKAGKLPNGMNAEEFVGKLVNRFDTLESKVAEMDDLIKNSSAWKKRVSSGFSEEDVKALEPWGLGSRDYVRQNASWWDQNYGNFAKNLDADEKAALQSYTGSGYDAINDALRKYGQTGDKTALKGQLTKIKNLDLAFAKASLKEDVLVTRNASTWTDASNGRIIKTSDTPGKILGQHNFMSTSSKINGAMGGDHMEIRIPAGTRAIWAKTVSHHAGEEELLVDRGYRIMVTGVKDVNGVKYYQGILLPENVNLPNGAAFTKVVL